MKITIQHQEEKTYHTFNVIDPNSLTVLEVMAICEQMRVVAIFVNGKYYQYK
jgi:hypothetical protein